MPNLFFHVNKTENLTSNKTMAALRCLVCAIDLPRPGVDVPRRRGQRRHYCSSACKQMAYRYRDDPQLAEVLEARRTGRPWRGGLDPWGD